MNRFMKARGFDDYASLHRWSIDNVPAGSVLEVYENPKASPDRRGYVLSDYVRQKKPSEGIAASQPNRLR